MSSDFQLRKLFPERRETIRAVVLPLVIGPAKT